MRSTSYGLASWRGRLFQLISQFQRPPLGFWAQAFTVVHLFGNPIDKVASFLYSQTSIRMRFGPAKIKIFRGILVRSVTYLGQILCKFTQIIPNFLCIYTYMCIKYALTSLCIHSIRIVHTKQNLGPRMLRIILVERYPYFPLLKVGGLTELSLLVRIPCAAHSYGEVWLYTLALCQFRTRKFKKGGPNRRRKLATLVMISYDECGNDEAAMLQCLESL